MKRRSIWFSSDFSVLQRYVLSMLVLGGIVIATLMVCFMIALNIVRETERHMDRGTVFLSQGRFEESLENFENVLKSNPRRKLAWAGKGLCLMSLGRYYEALAHYEKALVIYPDYAVAWLGKGMSYEYLGNYKDALVCFDKAHEILPEYGLVIKLQSRVMKKLNTSRYSIQ